MQLIFYEKIKLKVYANQDDFVSELHATAMVMISIVFASWIIPEYVPSQPTFQVVHAFVLLSSPSIF